MGGFVGGEDDLELSVHVFPVGGGGGEDRQFADVVACGMHLHHT